MNTLEKKSGAIEAEEEMPSQSLKTLLRGVEAIKANKGYRSLDDLTVADLEEVFPANDAKATALLQALKTMAVVYFTQRKEILDDLASGEGDILKPTAANKEKIRDIDILANALVDKELGDGLEEAA